MNNFYTVLLSALCFLAITSTNAMEQQKLELDPFKAMHLGFPAIQQVTGPDGSIQPTLDQWVTALREQQLLVSCKVKDILRDFVFTYKHILDGIARNDLNAVEDGRRSFLLLRKESRGVPLKMQNPGAAWFMGCTFLEPKESPFPAAMKKAIAEVMAEQKLTQAMINQFSLEQGWKYNCDIVAKCLPALEMECKLRLALEGKALEEVSKIVTDEDEQLLAKTLGE